MTVACSLQVGLTLESDEEEKELAYEMEKEMEFGLQQDAQQGGEGMQTVGRSLTVAQEVHKKVSKLVRSKRYLPKGQEDSKVFST